MHWGAPQNPIESFAVFDTVTGALQNTMVEEIGHHCVNALPDGRVLFLRADQAAGTTGPFVIWNAATQETTDLIGCVSPSDVWNTDPGGRSHQAEFAPSCLDGGTPFVTAAAPVMSADGTEVMAADLDGTALIWDTLTLEVKDTLDLGGVAGGPVWIEAVGADWVLMRRVTDEAFLVIDRSTLETLAQFEFPIELNAEIARDGSFLIMRHLDSSVHRVDTDDWQPQLLHTPGQFVRGLALSPTGDRLMLGGTDGFVTIIDAETGALLDQIPLNHVSDGHWVDEDHIAVGTGQTGMWTVISLDIQEVLVHAADQLTRAFTDEECRIYRIDPCPTLDQIRVAASRTGG
jgi:WD40 repeat protein